MQFQKGQSGNPNGRPRKGKTLTEAMQKVLQEEHEPGVTKGEAVARKLVELALVDGNIPAIKEIYDRLEGRSTQPLEHTGKRGGGVILRVV